MAPDVVVAVEPAETTVDPGETFSVKVTVEDVADLGGYEFEMAFTPEVVEVVDAEDLGFLGSTGRQVIESGLDIDNEAGTMTVGVFSVGSSAGADGSGDLAVITLKALEDGVTDLDLLEDEVLILDTAGALMTATVEDGRVRVGDAPLPTATPTEESTATATTAPSHTPTSASETPTETPRQAPTEAPTEAPTGAATETPTEDATPTGAAPTATEPLAEGATATRTATMAPTQKPSATATKPPTEDVTATAAPTGGAELDTAEPAATAGSEGSEGAEPAPTTDAAGGEGQAKSGLSGTAVWLVGGAAALGVLGLALIIGGIFFFGPRGRSSADGTEEEDEAP